MMVDWLVCLVPRPLGATPRPPWRRTPSGQHLSSLHTTPLILAKFHKDYQLLAVIRIGTEKKMLNKIQH